jgi:uncharacterized protein (DUF2164 family)
MRGKPEIILPPAARARAVASLKRYFEEELEQDIGNLRAGLLLDYLLGEIGPSVHNLAIADARVFFEARAADLDGVSHRAEFPWWDRVSRGE